MKEMKNGERKKNEQRNKRKIKEKMRDSLIFSFNNKQEKKNW